MNQVDPGQAKLPSWLYQGCIKVLIHPCFETSWLGLRSWLTFSTRVTAWPGLAWVNWIQRGHWPSGEECFQKIHFKFPVYLHTTVDVCKLAVRDLLLKYKLQIFWYCKIFVRHCNWIRKYKVYEFLLLNVKEIVTLYLRLRWIPLFLFSYCLPLTHGSVSRNFSGALETVNLIDWLFLLELRVFYFFGRTVGFLHRE